MISGKEYFRQTSWVTIQQILTKVVSFIYLTALTRLLSLLDLGVISVLSLIINAASHIALVRIHSYPLYKLPRAIGKRDLGLAKGVIKLTMGISLLFGLMIGAVVIIFNLLVAFTFKIQGYETLLLLSSLSVIIAPVTRVMRSNLTGLARADKEYTVSLVNQIGLTSVSLSVLNFWGLAAIPIGWFIGNLVALIFSLLFIRDIFLSPKYAKGRKPSIKELFTYSLPLTLGGSVNFFAEWIDRLIILQFLGLQIMGLYHFTYRLIMTVSTIAASPFVLFNPLMSESFTRDEKERQIIFERVARFILMVVSPIYLLCALNSTEIISFIFGQQFYVAGDIFTMFSWAFAIQTATSIMIYTFNAGGYTREDFYERLANLSIKSVVLYFIVLISFSQESIAISWVISAIGALAFVMFRFKRMQLYVNSKKLMKLFFSLGIVYSGVWVFSIVFNTLPDPVIVLSSSVLFIIFHSLMLIMLRFFSKEDIMFLYRTIPTQLYPLINLIAKLSNIKTNHR